MPHQLGGYYLKEVGNNDEQGSQNQMPFVFKQVFVEVSEFFHLADIDRLRLKRNIILIVRLTGLFFGVKLQQTIRRHCEFVKINLSAESVS